VYDIQKDLLVTELNIAKPDICLFVTGPNYDFILERYYPKIKFKELGLPVRQFAKLIHPQLPLRSYRMYHPNYLNWDRKGRWEMTFQILARELSWPTNSLQTASLSGRA
jgi:hypothetical protein